MEQGGTPPLIPHFSLKASQELAPMLTFQQIPSSSSTGNKGARPLVIPHTSQEAGSGPATRC
jgi:hypothetical protein